MGESSSFAASLERLLSDIKAVVDDPRVGLELVTAFFRLDGAIFECCDDSSGSIGDVFVYDASLLFAHFASQLEDKDLLAEQVLDLALSDEYGVRGDLLKHSAAFLPEMVMRDMVARLWSMAEKESGSYLRGSMYSLIESLATQLNDPSLFERVKIKAHPEPNARSCLDIAKAHFASGQADIALAWVERIPPSDIFHAYDRDKLLLDIYAWLGTKEKLAEVAWKRFRSHRDFVTLLELLDVVGNKQRDAILAAEVRAILEDASFSAVDAAFLANLGLTSELECYLLKRSGLLNGDDYVSLLPLAEYMAKESCALAASLIHRVLLESILGRGVSRFYHHGVRYLKILDAIATSVSDWKDFAPHTAYLAEIRKAHGRKSSFWSRYEQKS